MKYAYFSKSLKEACADAGINLMVRGTQRELAKKWGVSTTMVSYYLNGEKLPSMQTLRTIAINLNVSPDSLFLSNGKGTTASKEDVYLKN